MATMGKGNRATQQATVSRETVAASFSRMARDVDAFKRRRTALRVTLTRSHGAGPALSLVGHDCLTLARQVWLRDPERDRRSYVLWLGFGVMGWRREPERRRAHAASS